MPDSSSSSSGTPLIVLLPGWSEYKGSPQITSSRSGGTTGTRMFFGPWEDRIAFMEAMAFTQYPGAPHCYPDSMSAVPFSQEMCPDYNPLLDVSTALATYSRNGGRVCLVTISYSIDYYLVGWPTDIPKPSFLATTTLKFKGKIAGRMMLYPSRFISTDENTTSTPTKVMPQADLKIPKPIPVDDITVEWNYVYDPPINYLRTLRGAVNSGTFLGFAAEQLLFEGFDIDQSFRPVVSSPVCHKLSFTFKGQAIWTGAAFVGWNHQLVNANDGGAKWARIEIKTNPKGAPFRSVDFTDMFTKQASTE